jgi:hypothetical protein
MVGSLFKVCESYSESHLYFKEHLVKEHPVPCTLERRRDRFPSLVPRRERVLCIAASSTPSERVFIYTGNVVTNKSCQFTAETVNMLVTPSQNVDCFDWELETKKKVKF